jgi:hypothetical protein
MLPVNHRSVDDHWAKKIKKYNNTVAWKASIGNIWETQKKHPGKKHLDDKVICKIEMGKTKKMSSVSKQNQKSQIQTSTCSLKG